MVEVAGRAVVVVMVGVVSVVVVSEVGPAPRAYPPFRGKSVGIGLRGVNVVCSLGMILALPSVDDDDCARDSPHSPSCPTVRGSKQ